MIALNPMHMPSQYLWINLKGSLVVEITRDKFIEMLKNNFIFGRESKGIDTLWTLEDEVFTRRKVLSIISSFYDPMGLISAYLVIFKIMMRETTALPDLDWDDPLPKEMQEDWKSAIRMLVEQEEIVFDRCTRPSNALGRPELVGYWDGSLLAYAALLYIRWLLNTDPPSWRASLLCAKVRVTPVSGLTAPRTELNGSVVLGRVIDSAIPSLPVKPCRISMFGDSQCTISALESVTAVLGPYFANRILELESTRNGWGTMNLDNEMKETPLKLVLAENDHVLVDPVYHTAGDLNIADMATRGKVSVKDIGHGSLWQTGPSYLKERRESWPVSRSFLKPTPQEGLPIQRQGVNPSVSLSPMNESVP